MVLFPAIVCSRLRSSLANIIALYIGDIPTTYEINMANIEVMKTELFKLVS